MRLITGGPIQTMALAGPTHAIAVDRTRIIAVGDEALRLAGGAQDVQRTDLAGRTVVPGFIDAHHHLGAAALYRGSVDCSPRTVRDIETLLGGLSRTASIVPTGHWVLGFGYDEWALWEGRAPTRRELDIACPDHPALVMHFSFHQGVANSRALELAGIGRMAGDAPAGTVERDRHGEPTGRLYEMAVAGVERLAAADLLARDPEGFIARLERYQAELFALGISRVADPTVTRDLELLYERAHASGRLRMPVLMMPVSEHGYFAHPDDVLAGPTNRMSGPPTGEGTEALRIGPLKLFLDGGDNCAMCLTLAQGIRAAIGSAARMARARSIREAMLPLRYAAHVRRRLGRDLHFHTGLRYYENDAALGRIAKLATDRGFALAAHAMGNEAVAQAVRVVAGLGARGVGSPRLEHAMVVDAALIARIADVGAMVVSQPSFLRVPAIEFLPPLHGLRVLAHRSLRDAGVRVAGSSDGPVGEIAPLLGMHDAVTRRTRSGRLLDEREAVSPLNALAMYTRDAAAACGWSDVAGTLEPGRSADFAILSGDPLTMSFDTLQVMETVLAGETVFRREIPRHGREA